MAMVPKVRLSTKGDARKDEQHARKRSNSRKDQREKEKARTAAVVVRSLAVARAGREPEQSPKAQRATKRVRFAQKATTVRFEVPPGTRLTEYLSARRGAP